jgi:predicted dehydrogenase
MQQVKNAAIVAVCDLSPARAEATAERFGIKEWYTDFEKLLEQVQPDLVHVTTPPAAHFDIARRCLFAGANVLCEKPITPDYRQFLELKSIAQKKSLTLMENQNFRFHSSVRRILELINQGAVGNVIEVQLAISLNLFTPGNAYIDRNTPHFSSVLKGGIIGDFLPHLAYLSYLFTGPVTDLRAIWSKLTAETVLPADEFRCLIKGERATAYLAFCGNARPNGFWLRVTGTNMQIECNLFEPPRMTIRRFLPGEAAIGTVINGLRESRDVFRGTLAGFWRKLGGISSYDGLSELIRSTYEALERGAPQPVPLEEIDEVARLVDRFTSPDAAL